MNRSKTSRIIPILVLAALLLLPAAAAADGWGRPDLRLGFELGFIIPSEPAIYGQDLMDYINDNYTYEITYPLDNIISPRFTAYPGLTQGLIWENGFGLVLTEKFTIMPMDIAEFSFVKFKRIIVPVTLTARYEFMRNRQWRPFIGVGLGLYYISSSIDFSGQNFDDQTQFEPGFHAVAGVDLFRRKKVGLCVDIRYEYFKVDEYTGLGDWQEEINSLGIANGGNGGGVIFGIGVTFQNLQFVPFKSKR
ncbi:outer membrane beta-barrel protein [Thermodesulfobacteriota bacterium]